MAFSRLKEGFDSPMRYHSEKLMVEGFWLRVEGKNGLWLNVVG